jgi:thymidylate synthase (FAD)
MEVTLIDSMGDDLRVVNAARVSFAKEAWWKPDVFVDTDGTGHRRPIKKELEEADQKLINYLAKHNHWTPFSHVQITMREKVPIFIARQRFKHMVGFTYNEVSRRYVDDPPQFYTPDSWRKRAENKKQGSSDEDISLEVSQHFNIEGFHKECAKMYQLLIDTGVSPEQARMVLPQSMMTEYYVTGSLAAWARAYKLRIDPHAQKEIQDLAGMWNDVIGNIKELEHSWKALLSH